VDFHLLKFPALLAKEAIPVHSIPNRHRFERRVFMTALGAFLPVPYVGAIVAKDHRSTRSHYSK
jgi:hypothetical protein